MPPRTFKSWKERPAKLEEAAKRVELGEYQCVHNPTVSSRNPYYNAADKSQQCPNTATHVETITRTFVMMTSVLDLPLCDEHKGWYF